MPATAPEPRAASGGALMSMRAALTAPGAPPLVIWSFAGRLALAMTNLSLLLFLTAERGSYAVAGALSAASMLGTATGMLTQSRLIDRYGPARILLPAAVAHAILSAAAILAISADLPTLPLAMMIAAQCAALPAVAVGSRVSWPRLLPPGRTRDAAYSYEAVSFEVCWLLGPALGGLLATLFWPGTGLITACVLLDVAALGFATSLARRSRRSGTPPDADRPASHPESPVEPAGTDPGTVSPVRVQRTGMATLLVAVSGFGLGIGLVLVAVAAGTAAHGRPELAGMLIALWSASSVGGGLIHQRWPRPRRLADRLPILLAGFGTLLLLPVMSGHVLTLAATMIASGATLAPQAAIHSTALDALVPESRLSAAYGWVTTTAWAATAGGQAAAGLIVQAYGYRAAFLAAAVGTLLLAAAVWTRRRHLPPRRAG